MPALGGGPATDSVHLSPTGMAGGDRAVPVWSSSRIGGRWRRIFSYWLPPTVSAVVSLAMLERLVTRTASGRRLTLFDDAMISMRYARNLIDGHGLVWNPGAPPSQGYTNLLWTLWMAICNAVPNPDRWAPVLVALSAVTASSATVVVVGRLADRLMPGGTASAAARWTTALSFPLLGWAIAGMEVALLALLLSSAALAALHWVDGGGDAFLAAAGLLATLAVLTRTDAVLPAGVLAIWCWSQAPRGRRLVTGAMTGGPVAGALVATTGFSLAYYGHPFPTTYYLKLSHIPLSVRLHRGLLDLVWAVLTELGVPALLAIVALLAMASRRRPAIWLIAGMAAVQVAYAVYTGGDTYDASAAGSRYIAVTLPLVIALAAVGVAVLALQLARRALALAVVLLAVPLLVLRVSDARPGQWYELGPYFTHGLVFRVGALVVLVLGALAAVVHRPPARSWTTSTIAGLLGLALLAGGGGTQTAAAFRSPDLSIGFDSRMMQVAFAARAATDPRASIGAGGIGQLGYYSGRTVIDLLGYTDQRVAAGGPVPGTRFVPGHDKWNLAYSLGQFRPDLLIDPLPAPSVGDMILLRRFGYQELAPGLWIRANSREVNRGKLGALITLLTPRPAR